MRTLPRYPVCYRATLWLDDRQFTCLTHDLHGAGLRLHFAQALPAHAAIGALGRVALEARVLDGIELECEVRHVTGRDIGLRFVTPRRLPT